VVKRTDRALQSNGSTTFSVNSLGIGLGAAVGGKLVALDVYVGEPIRLATRRGRFVSAADPNDPAGTSDEAAALKDESGEPVANAARNTWVTETALSTALNVSYMASQIALFSIVVGIALLLAGIGFVILALAVFGRRDEAAAA
jgi:hypothetical protein